MIPTIRSSSRTFFPTIMRRTQAQISHQNLKIAQRNLSSSRKFKAERRYYTSIVPSVFEGPLKNAVCKNEQRESYGKLSSECYSLWFPDGKEYEDAPMYRRYIKMSAAPALELGCGNGRLLVPFLKEGLQIDGVDLSPHMVRICRERVEKSGFKADIYQQAMQRLNLPKRYGTIFIPYGSFMLVDNKDEANEALKRFHHHMVSGGHLLISLFIPTQSDIHIAAPNEDEWRLRREGKLPEGTLVRCWEKASFDPINQIENSEYRYEVVKEGTVITVEHEKLRLLWHTQNQMIERIAKAGFSSIKCLKAYCEELASPDDSEFTFVARKN